MHGIIHAGSTSESCLRKKEPAQHRAQVLTVLRQPAHIRPRTSFSTNLVHPNEAIRQQADLGLDPGGDQRII